jgi:hypothetical protein
LLETKIDDRLVQIKTFRLKVKLFILIVNRFDFVVLLTFSFAVEQQINSIELNSSNIQKDLGDS